MGELKLGTKEEQVDQHFSSVSGVYNKVQTTDAEPVEYLKKEHADRGKTMAADIGTGAGRYALKLMQEIPGLHLKCVDINKDMLEITRGLLENNGVSSSDFEIVHADAAQLPLETNTFDTIMTWNAVHHFDLDVFYKEARRSLKEGAHLYVYTRLQAQNAASIWGQNFPSFCDKETRLYALDQLERYARRCPGMNLETVNLFRFPRTSSLSRLVEQARSGHYSTFKLYSDQEFEKAVDQFSAAVKEQFSDVDKVQWTDENVMMKISAV